MLRTTILVNSDSHGIHPPAVPRKTSAPRSLLKGGDLPHGGTPPAVGHAGRTGHAC